MLANDLNPSSPSRFTVSNFFKLKLTYLAICLGFLAVRAQRTFEVRLRALLSPASRISSKSVSLKNFLSGRAAMLVLCALPKGNLEQGRLQGEEDIKISSLHHSFCLELVAGR